MTTINVPLDEITRTDFSTTPDVWIGTTKDDPEVRGFLRTKAGTPLPDDLDERLASLGVVNGSDGANVLVDDDGTVWVPLHEAWADHDPRWLLTEAGKAALTVKS